MNFKFAHPCIKWVGSKRNQNQTIIPILIENLQPLYIEPFIGGASVLINLLKECVLQNISGVEFRCFDIMPILIQMYNEIKNDPNELMLKLDQYQNKNDKENYYMIREQYNRNPTVEAFIYLNKTSFRGIYQIGKNGEYNTSYGSERYKTIYIPENIITLSYLFNKFDVQFECADYRDVLRNVNYGLVYLDPPFYETVHKYYQKNFDTHEYIRILNKIKQNSKIKLVHSNSLMFEEIYETDENKLLLHSRNRINRIDAGKTRYEVLYF
jgi:DNA adenine methylase